MDDECPCPNCGTVMLCGDRCGECEHIDMDGCTCDWCKGPWDCPSCGKETAELWDGNCEACYDQRNKDWQA